MSAGWVACSIRARALARRRLAVAATLRLARSDLATACAALRGTAYDDAADAPDLAAAQHAVAASVLWQLRVLAGWMPAQGTGLVRAVAAGFERENLINHAHRLVHPHQQPGHQQPGQRPPDFDLGSLGTVWSRARSCPSLPALLEVISSSGWGPVEVDDPRQAAGRLHDQLTASWLRRLSRVAPAARPVIVSAAALHAARVGSGSTAGGVARNLEIVLGRGWRHSGDLDQLRARLGRRGGEVLADIHEPDQLWQAEARFWALLRRTGVRLLADPLPGPRQVIGALAVIGADAFGVSAALAVAAAGGAGEAAGASDVLDLATGIPAGARAGTRVGAGGVDGWAMPDQGHGDVA